MSSHRKLQNEALSTPKLKACQCLFDNDEVIDGVEQTNTEPGAVATGSYTQPIIESPWRKLARDGRVLGPGRYRGCVKTKRQLLGVRRLVGALV